MKHIHHIIKCVNGKRVRTNETKSLTIKEHAKEHKRLWFKWGFKEDYLAWQGLSGQMPKQKIIQEIYTMNGKRNQKYTQSKEAIEKMRKTKLGSKLTKEHRQAISKGLMGHKGSEYQKQRLRETRQRDYIITYKNNTFKITNLLEFCRKKKLDQGNMTKVAQKKLQSHKGYSVRYA